MKRTLRQTILLMMFAILPLSASSSSAQNLVTLRLDNATLETFFDAVRKQTGNVFVYSTNDVDTRQTVSVDSRNEAVTDVLNRVLGGKNLSYNITDNYVVVHTAAKAQQPPRNTAVGGTVRDSAGNPVPAAAVMVVGTSFGVPTDAQGRYEILAPAGAVLRFSHIGMVSQDVPVNGRTRIDVVLQGQVVSTDRVIVTGYQTISRDRVTGSFGTISEADLADRLSPNFQSILEGQVAGMMMGKNNKVEIRGVSTFRAGQQPLIVVDGFPIETSQFDNWLNALRLQQNPITGDGTLDNINYDNVASITVLKDGVAASIYGSRAANGVIVITTKNGAVGKPVVTYKGVFGVTAKPRVADLNLSSTSDYVDASLDFYDETNYMYSYYSLKNINEINWLRMMQDGNRMEEADVKARIDGLRGNNFAKDVEKHLLRNEMSHHHSIGVSGGSETATYNTSLQYIDTRGNFIRNNSDKVIFDMKNTFKISRIFSAQVSANMAYSKLKTPTMAPNTDMIISNFFSFVPTANSRSMFQPYTAMFNPDGTQASIFGMSPFAAGEYASIPQLKDVSYHLLDDIARETLTQSNFQTRVNGMLRANIINGLTAEAGGSWQRGSYVRKTLAQADAFRMRVAFNDATKSDDYSTHYFPDGDMIDEVRTINDNWTLRGQLNFSRSFNGEKHRINAIFGNEIRRTSRDANTMDTRLGYNSVAGSYEPINIKDFSTGVYDENMINGRSIGLTQGYYTYQDSRFVSWYGNGSYEFNNRYIVSGSVRWDLTNFFGTDPRYRNRPMWSVGGTWKAANEKFFNVKWIDRLDVRASYGLNGNIALEQGPFLILSTGAWDPRTGGISYGVSSPPNYALRWEKTQTSNLGFDISLLANRLTMSIDLYNRLSSDLLSSANIDKTTGFNSVIRNVGSIRNRGIEVTLDGAPVATENFRWSVGLNFSYNENKVLAYDAGYDYPSQMTMAGAINMAGYPATGLWVFRYAGLNESGHMMAYNKKGEKVDPGIITKDDMVYGGTTRPTTELSLTNRFNYKNWDLSFMLIGRFGHKFVQDHFDGSDYTAKNRHLADRWRKPGDEAHTIYPELSYNSNDYWYFPYTDILLKNAGYAKLRDVTLGYSLGQRAARTLGLSGVKFWVQARNLFTITAKGVDVDPETVDMGSNGVTGFRIPREFYAGVQITF